MHVLASHLNSRGLAFPSEALLALETSSSVRHVRRAVAEWERLGVLSVTRRRAHLANIYQVDVAALESLPRLSRPDTLSALAIPRPDRQDGQTGQIRPPDRTPCPPNGSRNGSGNGMPSASGSITALVMAYQELFEATYHRKPYVARGKDGRLLQTL